MARTHRSNSSSASDTDNLPRYFGKHGFPDQDPKKVKKNGSGRFNWGNAFDDIDDLDATAEFNFVHSRRRSNSSSMYTGAPKSSGSEFTEVFDEEDDE